MAKISALKEIEEREEKSFARLCEDRYGIENIYQPSSYDWDGDFEGRALLAFVCHYKMSGRKIPCMQKLFDTFPEHLNEKGFFGNIYNEVSEQQLSGHSWVLRGLAEYYEQFGDEKALCYMRKTVENLYYPLDGFVGSYPIERDGEDGGVSGHSTQAVNGWRLSTDVGCAFMSIDGLSHYYVLTHDEKAGKILNEMIDVFDGIDKIALKAQTHCSLSAARGMIRLFEDSGKRDYLEKAIKIMDIYISDGMTYTYQNFNWWGRKDTWTEPCAIVDSLILALKLYKITNEEKYATLARRIFHNGFASSQRPNGGAGTDSAVYEKEEYLYMQMDEAWFCCTMRFAEGLYFAKMYSDVLDTETSGNLVKDEKGRYFDGDIMYAESGMGDIIEKDGHGLSPLVKFYKAENIETIKQKIIF